MTEKKTIPLNVMLSATEKEQLRELAAAHGMTLSYYLRSLLNGAHNMKFRKIPTCATGRHCVFPHLLPENTPQNPNQAA